MQNQNEGSELFRKNYVPGTKCDKELLVTDDILAVLNMLETEIPGESGGLSTQPQTSGTSGFTPSPTTLSTERQEASAANSQTFLPLVSPPSSTSSSTSKISNTTPADNVRPLNV